VCIYASRLYPTVEELTRALRTILAPVESALRVGSSMPFVRGPAWRFIEPSTNSSQLECFSHVVIVWHEYKDSDETCFVGGRGEENISF
jgi:hypothetical protein